VEENAIVRREGEIKTTRKAEVEGDDAIVSKEGGKIWR
jgi:hypothetical protein